MPIRTRTTTDFFEKEKAKEDYSAPPEQPVSLGSATKPVNWKRAQRPHRAPLERPAHSLERKKPVAPVVDGSESFLGVFLPRPSVNLTRSSFSDLRAKDVKVTEDFKRPATPRSQRGGTQVSGRASDLFEDGLAPDFEPIELVSVALLFPKASPTRPSTTRDGTSTPTPAPALPATPTRVPASQFDDGASVVTATDVSTSLAPPPTTPSKRKSSGFGLRIPSRLSLRSVSESRPETPLSALPSLPSSRKVDAADGDLDTELLPPQPSFLRDSASPRKRNRASSVGGDTTASGRPSSAISSRFHRPPPPPPATAPAAEAFVPKMATILTRFSSRQMGDHKCKRGYPIAVFCGAQSMDVGSITNPKIEGAYTLFFGPGHPANVQQAMTDSERRPSHLHNPKPPTTSSTARRAELIAATRALQAIHDLYQGKACAHVCMDSPYVAKAWGSWIPQWEEDGWPGDEHISKRKKDSGYQGSGDFSGSDEVPRKRSSKRLADEDLLRQLAAIRRLYARAERKGTGAAHLYLIDRNSNPASKTARVVLDNCKAQEFASPTQSPTESRRDSFMSSRPSMTIDALGAGRNSRLSMSGSRRSATRESLYDEDGRGSRRSNSRASNGRTRTVSHRPAPPVPVQEEAESDLRDDDVDMVAAPAAKAPRKVSKKKVAAAAAAPAAVVVAATQRPESIKSAASAVTALSENEDEVVPAAKPAAVEPAPVAKAAPALAMPVAPAAEPVTEVKEVKKASPPATADESDEGVVKHDGLLASAAATAAAFVAGMTGSRTPEAKEPEAAVPEEPEAAVPEEAAAPTVDLDGPTATDPVEAAVVEVKDPGVAVPEEPEVVLAPAAVISTPKKTPTKKAKAVPVAAAEDVVTPTKTKSVKKSASSARKPKLANAVVDPPSPSRGSPTRGSPTRAKSVEPMPASPAAPAKAALASPAPTPDKSGRLINYSKRNSMMKAKKEADEAAGVAAPAAGTLAVGSALKSTTEEKVEPVQLVDDAAAPLTEVDEEESEAAVLAATATKVVPVAAASTVADSDVAEPTVPAGYPKPLAAARTTPNGKTVKKQQSMPATRASRDLSSGGDRVSLKSSTSSVGRRFRTLSTSFGRSSNRAGLGASPEEEEAVAAVAADKKARRKTMKWFKKGEDVPPVPVVPVAAAPAAAAEEESEVAAPATESVVPEGEESEVAAPAAAPRTNGSAALLRPGHRRQPTEQSVFEDDEDDVSVVPTKANGAAAPAAATPVSPAKSSRLSRMSMSKSSAPKSPKPIKTPKPAKEPKAPKPAKAPKEPKEPFSFKRSMGKILTME